jgi:hypothetical protein
MREDTSNEGRRKARSQRVKILRSPLARPNVIKIRGKNNNFRSGVTNAFTKAMATPARA